MIKAPWAFAGVLALSALRLAHASQTDAVEFYHPSSGHFFVTASASEALGIDRGLAGPGWVRTGRAFQVWSDASSGAAGTRAVCRFYSSLANSHFYTASAEECERLKALAASELARTGQVRGWAYEGIAFQAQVPESGRCAAGTLPLSRVYNDGFANGQGSNHRFVDDAALRQLMVDRAWIDEGVVLCAPAKASGTGADLPPTTTTFDPVAGTWRGIAKWEVETAAAETEARAPLELVIGADGSVSGTGNGCTFAGRLARGDGFRSLYTGSIAASGCAVAEFNGDYPRLFVERFDGGIVLAKIKREQGGVEVSIAARLANGAIVDAPPAAGLEAVAGEWVGTVGWEVEGPGGAQAEANRVLTLAIGAQGTVTGSGFGCTFAGTLGPSSSEGRFRGNVTGSGCEVAAFNGALDLRVRRGERGLKVEISRESDGTEVEIEGTLLARDAAPPPPPPPAAAPFTFVGSWSANGRASARESRWGGSASRTDAAGPLRLAIAADGAVSGSGFGCTFSGRLALAAGGARVTGGSIVAAGCSQPVFDGTYPARLEREDGGVELELEREARTAAGELEVKIEALLRRD